MAAATALNHSTEDPSLIGAGNGGWVPAVETVSDGPASVTLQSCPACGTSLPGASRGSLRCCCEVGCSYEQAGGSGVGDYGSGSPSSPSCEDGSSGQCGRTADGVKNLANDERCNNLERDYDVNASSSCSGSECASGGEDSAQSANDGGVSDSTGYAPGGARKAARPPMAARAAKFARMQRDSAGVNMALGVANRLGSPSTNMGTRKGTVKKAVCSMSNGATCNCCAGLRRQLQVKPLPSCP